MTEPVQLDDLQYDWPTNITGYDSKLILGIGLYEAVLAAMIGLGASMLLGPVAGTGPGYLLGMLLGGLALILLRKHEALGNRRIPGYLIALLRHRFQQGPVTLAWIMPSAPLEIEIVASQTDSLAFTAEEQV